MAHTHNRSPSSIFSLTVTVIITTFIISLTWKPVQSLGKRSFGEECHIGGQITSFFSQEREEQTCDSDKGLICTGRCACPPGRVWDDSSANFFGVTVGNGRGCARAVGSPCFGSGRNAVCVSGAHCEHAICRCNKGYRPHGRGCSSSSSNGVNINIPDFSGIFNNFNINNNNNNNHHQNNHITKDDKYALNSNYNNNFNTRPSRPGRVIFRD